MGSTRNNDVRSIQQKRNVTRDPHFCCRSVNVSLYLCKPAVPELRLAVTCDKCLQSIFKIHSKRASAHATTHDPPQSVPVSSPFSMPSEHVGPGTWPEHEFWRCLASKRCNIFNPGSVLSSTLERWFSRLDAGGRVFRTAERERRATC